MSRESLAVKFRPRKFSEVVEQTTIKQILQRQIETNNLKRVLLFTGGAGTGKTTNARIFANEIEPVRANIIEMNAADHTGVDDMRLIIDQCKSKPLQGNYKIFIIDECHQLTPQAQNSLLKILEEPPSYCIFILCTTDPQKILGTILSRAYRYDFQLISAQGIVDRLNFILNSEKADPEGYDVQTWDQPALYYLARNSKGHLRDAITLLDKTLSYTSNVNTDAVIQVLGVTSYDIMFELLFRLRSKDIEALTSSLEQLKATGKNLKLFVKDFLSFLLDVNKYTLFRNYDYIDIPNTYEDKLNQITQNDKQLLRNLIQTFIKLNTDIKWETNPAILLESTLLLEVM